MRELEIATRVRSRLLLDPLDADLLVRDLDPLGQQPNAIAPATALIASLWRSPDSPAIRR